MLTYTSFQADFWNLILSLFVGLCAGFVAGQILKGRGFGLFANIVIGVLGGLLGGFLFTLLGWNVNGLFGTFIMAVVGAIVLLLIVSFLSSLTSNKKR